MKGICSIILLISTIVSFAGEVDSRAIVWYKGSTFYQALNKKKNTTLYFSSWEASISRYLTDNTYKVAYQLDGTLDPFPEDDLVLPNMKWLAAVSDSDLLREYLTFLEDYSRTAGFDHLVLPDTINLSAFEKEVIDVAVNKSPTFFISNTRLSKNLPESKRDVIDAGALIWIVDQASDTRKISKWSKKQARNFYRSFNEEISSASKRRFDETKELPSALLRQLFENGVVGIDPEQTLPLRSKSVVYLGDNAKLKARISQYVNVFDKPQAEPFPVILDKRAGYEGKTFGNEIVIDFNWTEAENRKGLMVPGSIENDDIIIAKMLFGATPIRGRFEEGRLIEAPGFIGYSTPGFEGVDEQKLGEINSFIEQAIKKYATPGSQLAVLKNGSVILERSYGFFTYDSLKAVESRDLFDLASITKVAATLPAIALLVDQGKISLDDSIGMHLPDFRNSNKSQITIKQLLAHNGGVRSYIPFWRMAISGDRLDAFYYKTKEDEAQDIRTYGLAPHPALKDTLKSWIRDSDLIENTKRYNYSDLGYMILHLLVESVSETTFDKFMIRNFYEPMQLGITFNPISNGIPLENIVPTEYDERYRNDQVWGEVHDRNAHAFGGISGHAGLFSNASDLAKMMYMLSNGGYYNGIQYIKAETLNTFNLRHFQNNRRGLGWDKKDGKRDAASSLASDSSFGHTGFTGTMVWADPENELIFVFLSNRIYPDSNNSRLMELNTRTEIHDVIYKSILND
ncbi:MAG: serine hydrolase [Cyclobacteriaceae bacterium]